MKFGTAFIGLMLASCVAGEAGAAQIATAPGDSIIQNPANGNGFVDLMVHAAGIRADAGEQLNVRDIKIELMRGGATILTETVSAADLVQDTRKLMSAPVPQFISGQLLNGDGIAGFFGRPTTAGSSAKLVSGQALVTSRHYFAVNGPIDAIRITLDANDASNRPVKLEKIIPVIRPQATIKYQSPLKGVWLERSLPSLQSHHRFNPSTEFALDFFKINERGELFSGGDTLATDYFGFGAPVSAAADGQVVAVIDGVIQDRKARTQQPGETREAAMQRASQYNMAEYQRDFAKASAGNLVVIRHTSGANVEYSSYGHLQAGIPVKVGDQVHAGDLIGHVGDTGDSPTVHLHFQVNAGENPFTSKSLPVNFPGLKSFASGNEPGIMVDLR